MALREICQRLQGLYPSEKPKLPRLNYVLNLLNWGLENGHLSKPEYNFHYDEWEHASAIYLVELADEFHPSAEETALKAAGFTVHSVHRVKRGMWFDVTAPNGEKGAVLNHGEWIWHFFSCEFAATSSGTSIESCQTGGLGDAIETDEELAEYQRLLRRENVPSEFWYYRGVYESMDK
jgi:hypothetical protein